MRLHGRKPYLLAFDKVNEEAPECDLRIARAAVAEGDDARVAMFEEDHEATIHNQAY